MYLYNKIKDFSWGMHFAGLSNYTLGFKFLPIATGSCNATSKLVYLDDQTLCVQWYFWYNRFVSGSDKNNSKSRGTWKTVWLLLNSYTGRVSSENAHSIRTRSLDACSWRWSILYSSLYYDLSECSWLVDYLLIYAPLMTIITHRETSRHWRGIEFRPSCSVPFRILRGSENFTGRIGHQCLLLVVKSGEMGVSSDKIKTNKQRSRVTADVAL